MGFVCGPSPRIVTADTVTLISEDGVHSDDEISNSLLQTPLIQEVALIECDPHTAPVAESKYLTVYEVAEPMISSKMEKDTLQSKQKSNNNYYSVHKF